LALDSVRYEAVNPIDGYETFWRKSISGNSKMVCAGICNVIFNENDQLVAIIFSTLKN
jgi:hypothetical protein